MKFFVPNYSCLQNPWLRGYRPQIPVPSVLCPQLNLLNPPPEKNSWVRHWHIQLQSSVGVITFLFTPDNAMHGRCCRVNMQWCPWSVDVLIMDWSSCYGFVVYLRERMDLFVVCGVAFRRFVTVIRSLGVSCFNVESVFCVCGCVCIWDYRHSNTHRRQTLHWSCYHGPFHTFSRETNKDK